MITTVERNRIAQVIFTTKDETVIRKIESIIFPTDSVQVARSKRINKNEMLDWDEVPDEVKASIERGLAQSKAGQTTPHAEVMKKYKKWLKK